MATEKSHSVQYYNKYAGVNWQITIIWRTSF